MKLIFILRNPIERAYSQWNMQHARGIEMLDFETAIDNEKMRLEDIKNPNTARRYAYLERGHYATQIMHILGYFSRKQMLFLKTEWLREDHKSALARICEFLGVDGFPEGISGNDVFSQTYAPMQESTKKRLARFYRPGIEELEALLGWDCKSWFAG